MNFERDCPRCGFHFESRGMKSLCPECGLRIIASELGEILVAEIADSDVVDLALSLMEGQSSVPGFDEEVLFEAFTRVDQPSKTRIHAKVNELARKIEAGAGRPPDESYDVKISGTPPEALGSFLGALTADVRVWHGLAWNYVLIIAEWEDGYSMNAEASTD